MSSDPYVDSDDADYRKAEITAGPPTPPQPPRYPAPGPVLDGEVPAGASGTADGWDFQRREGERLTLKEAVFQALGGASACWDNLRGAGVFESEQCKAIGDKLVDFIDSECSQIARESDVITKAVKGPPPGPDPYLRMQLVQHAIAVAGKGAGADDVTAAAVQLERWVFDRPAAATRPVPPGAAADSWSTDNPLEPEVDLAWLERLAERSSVDIRICARVLTDHLRMIKEGEQA